MFIERDRDGKIIAIHKDNPQGNFEQSSLKNREVIAFLQHSGNDEAFITDALAESDADLVRVVEDLIDLLITRNIINFTDLPPAAQTKIRNRQTMRTKLAQADFMVDDIL